MYKSIWSLIGVPLVRHGATGLGAYLVGNGLIMADQTQSLEGSAIFIAGVIWSAVEKYALHGR